MSRDSASQLFIIAQVSVAHERSLTYHAIPVATCCSIVSLAITVNLLPEAGLGEGVSDDLTTAALPKRPRDSPLERCHTRSFIALTRLAQAN